MKAVPGTGGRLEEETEEGGKGYQMRRRRSCWQYLTPDKGKKRKRENRFGFIQRNARARSKKTRE